MNICHLRFEGAGRRRKKEEEIRGVLGLLQPKHCLRRGEGKKKKKGNRGREKENEPLVENG